MVGKDGRRQLERRLLLGRSGRVASDSPAHPLPLVVSKLFDRLVAIVKVEHGPAQHQNGKEEGGESDDDSGVDSRTTGIGIRRRNDAARLGARGCAARNCRCRAAKGRRGRSRDPRSDRSPRPVRSGRR